MVSLLDITSQLYCLVACYISCISPEPEKFWSVMKLLSVMKPDQSWKQHNSTQHPSITAYPIFTQGLSLSTQTFLYIPLRQPPSPLLFWSFHPINTPIAYLKGSPLKQGIKERYLENPQTFIIFFFRKRDTLKKPWFQIFIRRQKIFHLEKQQK